MPSSPLPVVPLLASTGWPEENLQDPTTCAPSTAREASNPGSRGCPRGGGHGGAGREAAPRGGEEGVISPWRIPPAEPPVEAARPGSLVDFGDVDDDPVAAREPEPGDRLAQEPGPDPLPAPRFLDSQLPEVGPGAQSGKCSAVGEVLIHLAEPQLPVVE